MSSETLRARSISGTMLARVCILIGGLFTGIISARVLGPAGRGQYFAVTTAAAIVAQLSNLGLTSSNVFLGARDLTRVRPLLVNSVALASLLAAISGSVTAIWGPRIGNLIGVPVPMLWAICIMGAATLLWSLATSLLVAAERFAALNLWQVLNALIAVLGISACAVWRGSAQDFAFASAIAAALTALGVSGAIALQLPGALRFSPELVRQGLGFSSRAYLALVLSYLLQRSGATLLVAGGTSAEVGQYSIASQVADVLLIVPSSVGLVLYPLLVRHERDLWPQVRRTTLITTVSMLALALLAAALGPLVLPLVFGRAFTGAALPLWCLMPSVVAYSVVSVLSQYLVRRTFPAWVMAAWALGLVGALATGIPLTHNFGAFGAALAQSCGAALVCAVVVSIACRRANILATEGAA